jgi:tRNA threonylcarbamoyladenosine biosynthesis protein TsaB
MNDDAKVAQIVWHSDRQLASELLSKIDELLSSANVAWTDVKGLVVYKGPGSFTGLRIGCTVMNTLAYAHTLPIVGTMGDDWAQQGLLLLSQKADHVSVMPEYGAEPRITTPRK